MKNVLLVEPDYRSKFPPLGLLKIASYHKSRGDEVTFVRGMDESLRALHWHRIYVASLFTWELPRTVKTIKYYSACVKSPTHIFVGGIGATLLPDFIRGKIECTIIEGPLDKPGLLDIDSPAIANIVPDYSILDKVEYNYKPHDAYFLKITKGCIRSCAFCAVPKLEPEFGYLSDVTCQVTSVNRLYGERQNIVVLDNNILGVDGIEKRIDEIRDLGFERGAKRNGRKRSVDFNQGLDARLICENPVLAKYLAKICVAPVRLAFDFNNAMMEKAYRKAVAVLAEQGFSKFTNYMLFNFNDSPKDLYDRLLVNADLNEKLGVRITGFPMRFVPLSDVRRDYVSEKWHWRYLRGVQCVLLATRGLVSPNPEFVRFAFGKTYEEFLEILAMPDRYIIYRKEYENNGATDWRNKYRRLSAESREEFLNLLAQLSKDRNRKKTILRLRKYRDLIEHYYPNGETPPKTALDDMAHQERKRIKGEYRFTPESASLALHAGG
jgi:hypothetical protein